MQLQFFMRKGRYFDQADILLRFQHFQCFLGEFRRHDDFEENRFHFFCRCFVALAIHRDNTAESRLAVSREGFLECIECILTECAAAWICVLDDGAGRLVFPFAGQIPCCFHIDDVVVRKFFAVKLFRIRDAALHFRIFVESGFLVRVFAVTQVLYFHIRFAVDVRQGIFAAIDFLRHIVSDRAVIESGMQEGFSGEIQTEIFGERI